MAQQQNPRFDEQSGSEKLHGDAQAKKEKFLREGGKIEDYPEQENVAKMNSGSDKNESTHLTDKSGEEKKEDYINTDERKRDLNQRGL